MSGCWRKMSPFRRNGQTQTLENLCDDFILQMSSLKLEGHFLSESPYPGTRYHTDPHFHACTVHNDYQVFKYVASQCC